MASARWRRAPAQTRATDPVWASPLARVLTDAFPLATAEVEGVNASGGSSGWADGIGLVAFVFGAAAERRFQ